MFGTNTDKTGFILIIRKERKRIWNQSSQHLLQAG